MILYALGCSYRTAVVDVREKLAFNGEQLDRALDALTSRFDCEAVILSTCNRVELYVGQVVDAAPPGLDITEQGGHGARTPDVADRALGRGCRRTELLYELVEERLAARDGRHGRAV